jgi:hypothetical protein
MLSMTGIDAIFKKDHGDNYKNKSRMYQDILIFGSTIPENEEFKLWDLSRYLLYNNVEFRDRYKGSHLNESSRIEYIGKRVYRNVNHLVGLRVMAQVKLVKEERGTGLIPTFRFTPFGYILSQIIGSLRSGVNVEVKLYDLFHERLFKVQANSPSIVIFASNWIEKMYEKGKFAHYVSILKKVIDSKSVNNIEEFALLLQRTVNLRFFHNPANALLFVDTWEETIKELEPEIRKLFLHEQKLGIDVKMATRVRTLEYEKLRLTLIGDVEQVALESYCNECKQRVVHQMKILQYYRRLAHAHTELNGLAMKCPTCNVPHRTLTLPNIWE